MFQLFTPSKQSIRFIVPLISAKCYPEPSCQPIYREQIRRKP